MMYANNNNKRILAQPNSMGYCPLCSEQLIAKCGSLKIWHWSHKNKNDCDSWSEGETDWHKDWKDSTLPEFCEVKIGNHRADIKNNKGLVIELQHSPIDVETIKERERHYGKMIWLFDAQDFRLEFKKKSNYFTFRWKYPHRSIIFCSQPIFFDLGFKSFDEENYETKILEVKKLYNSKYVGGYGNIITRSEFIKRYLD